MASIEKRAQGRWRVRWRDPDGTERSRMCRSSAAAKQLHKEVEFACAQGKRWVAPDAGKESEQEARVDLRDVFAAFIRESCRVNKGSTAIGHSRALDLCLRQLAERHGADAPYGLELLTRSLLVEFYDWLELGLYEKPRKLDTKRRIVMVLESAWRWAAEESDEFCNIIPRPKRLKMPKGAGSPTVAPTFKELDAVIHGATGSLKQLYIVLRYTGLRVQQAMGLRWSDIDLERGLLTVRGEWGKTAQEMRGRIVPISTHFVEELRGWAKDDEWVVPSSRRSTAHKREARSREARRAWQRTEQRETVWRQRPHHAFRKGFVSELRRAGADPDAVEALIGHSLGLRGVYTDPEALPLREAVGLIPPIASQDPEKAATTTKLRRRKTKGP